MEVQIQRMPPITVLENYTEKQDYAKTGAFVCFSDNPTNPEGSLNTKKKKPLPE